MDRIWAPWRMEYLTGEKCEGCIFCVGESPENDRELLILHRSSLSFIIMNRYPYTNGHLMVIPYRHCSSLDDLGDEEIIDLMNSLRLARKSWSRHARPRDSISG